MRTVPAALTALLVTAAAPAAENAAPAAGPFQPTFESLTRYQCPDWFRDAKFGIWAHWGPQSVPMVGDWYARLLYEQDGTRPRYAHHVATYGHPSQFGYKDIISLWHAEKFDPDRLMALYRAAGARYFVSMGVHHDNFDLWNSKHHRWNAVQMGPKRDIVGAWRDAALKQGLRFGVSEHLGASYTWFQTSHGADKDGPLAGVPYDGADPRWHDLYHPRARPGDTAWYSTDPAWAREWAARISDLVEQHQPDLLYSDGALPFGEVGRTLLADFYNANLARHGGKLEAVYCLKDFRFRADRKGDYVEGIGVQDVERGGLSGIKPEPWQTDTSIGDWFYNKNWKTRDTGTMYRSPAWIIHSLVDIVSKNGNLLLNVIQRPDGSLDPEVEQLLADIAAWMRVHGEAIHATRPWLVCGEGPVETETGPFKEDYAFSAADIRFTRSKDGRTLYAIALGRPADGKLRIKSLARMPGQAGGEIERVELLGHAGALPFERNADGLLVPLPPAPVSPIACALKITGQQLHPPTRHDASP